jgi:hypothetical protein
VRCTPLFFLVLRGLVKRSLWGPLLRALRIPFGCVVLCGLVLACGSVVVRRSSRVFVVSVPPPPPVAWSQPTLVRYKAFTRCLQQFILLQNLILWRSGHAQDISCNGPYHWPGVALPDLLLSWSDRGATPHLLLRSLAAPSTPLRSPRSSCQRPTPSSYATDGAPMTSSSPWISTGSSSFNLQRQQSVHHSAAWCASFHGLCRSNYN